MEVSSEIIFGGVGMVLSAGTAWGIVTTRLHNKMGYREHDDICEKAQTANREDIKEIREAQKEIYGMIKEIHGYMKANNGGQI